MRYASLTLHSFRIRSVQEKISVSNCPICFSFCVRNDSDSLGLMNVHGFLPFWQLGWKVSRGDKFKLMLITWFSICLLNIVGKSVSCQLVDQIWQIYHRPVDLHRIGTRKSILQGRSLESQDSECSTNRTSQDTTYLDNHLSSKILDKSLQKN